MFSELSYEQVRDAYDAKERARGLISNSIRYAQYYNRDNPFWKQFNDIKSIDVESFCYLLEQSDIILSESQIDELVHDINVDGGNVITQQELENYLECDSANRELQSFATACETFPSCQIQPGL